VFIISGGLINLSMNISKYPQLEQW